MSAPLPALPVTEPMAAPVPAPSSPPDKARSPGVVPQAESATPTANTAASEAGLRVVFVNTSASVDFVWSDFAGRVAGATK
jgi:hypothetical protein